MTSRYGHKSCDHIVRLLKENGAFSKAQAHDRKQLDEQLVNKVEGVDYQQEVSFGLIELRRLGEADYDGGKKDRKRPVRKVWLTASQD